MIMTTATELARAQERQLKNHGAHCTREELDLLVQRCADAQRGFNGDWNESRPSYELDKYFPRGNRFEAWIAEWRTAGT